MVNNKGVTENVLLFVLGVIAIVGIAVIVVLPRIQNEDTNEQNIEETEKYTEEEKKIMEENDITEEEMDASLDKIYRNSSKLKAGFFRMQAISQKISADLGTGTFPTGNISDSGGTNSTRYEVEIETQPESYCLEHEETELTGVVEYKGGSKSYYYILEDNDEVEISEQVYTSFYNECVGL